MNAKLPNSSEVRFGNNKQPYAHARRWAINPGWFETVRRLNPQIGKHMTTEGRFIVLDAVVQAVMSSMGSMMHKDLAVLLDWDSYSLDVIKAATDHSHEVRLFFVCSSEAFSLEEWEIEPSLGHVSQPDASLSNWAISQEWIDWACRSLKFDESELASNGCTPKRVQIRNLLKQRLARISGVGVHQINAVIDWEHFIDVRSNAKKEDPVLFFMCSLKELDLTEPAPAGDKPLNVPKGGLIDPSLPLN